MERPPELLKHFAKRMSRLALSGGGAEMTRLLYLAGLTSTKPPAGEQLPSARPAADPANGSDRVGIWERKSEDGKSYFVRSNAMSDEWPFWANVARISPKRRRRVLLLGESVARGYLYDPQYTPAAALESILRSELGEDGVEVVDLARTNLQMGQLAELARSALALEPDAVVIFAGNNWHPSGVGLDGRRSAAAALREGGVRGLKQYAESGLRAHVEVLVKNVAAVYEAADVPVVWLVPEYNLADWRDPEGGAPSLGGDDEEWAGHWRRARAALAEGDAEGAAASAHEMARLDGGTSPTAFYLLAECSRRGGDHAGRKRYLELARDASVWDTATYLTPRPYTVAQEALRGEARRYGHALVDLPQLYSTYLNGEVPDRRLFLDYVHLNAEGIRIAAAAAAAAILNRLKGVDVPWETLAGKALMPGPQVEAEAAFLAAVHNAHYGQPYDLLRHHCSRAAAASPEIARVMQPFIDMQTRRAPFWMGKAAEQLALMQSPSVQQYLLRVSMQLLDALLIGAVVESLKEVGVDVRGQVAELRRQEHSVTRAACDLLDRYYCMTSPLQRGVTWDLTSKIRANGAGHYYKAYEPESRFFFVGEKSVPVELRLTCRLPGAASPEAALAVEVNGRSVAAINAGGEWQTWRVAVAGDLIADDVNEVVIRWPEPSHDHAALIERGAAEMERGQYPDLHPVSGEVHTFVASAARAGRH